MTSNRKIVIQTHPPRGSLAKTCPLTIFSKCLARASNRNKMTTSAQSGSLCSGESYSLQPATVKTPLITCRLAIARVSMTQPIPTSRLPSMSRSSPTPPTPRRRRCTRSWIARAFSKSMSSSSSMRRKSLHTRAQRSEECRSCAPSTHPLSSSGADNVYFQ